MRPAPLLLHVLLVAAGGSVAATAPIEGVYEHKANDSVTIQIIPGKAADTFAGVVVNATGERHRRQLNQTVLELSRVGDDAYRGRCSAYHMRFADDLTAWLEVTRADVLDSGDLRCVIKIPLEGTAEAVYRRVAGPVAPGSESRGLAGEWAYPDGPIVLFRRQGDAWVGETVELAVPGDAPGPADTKETVRVTQGKPGLYRGTVEVKGRDGLPQRTDDVEITVQGDRLTSVRTRKDGTGETRGAATRVSKYGAEPEPGAAPVPPRDPGDLTGLWRASDGTVTRYARDPRDATAYSGYVVIIPPDKERFGFRIGEEGVRLRRLGDSSYVGKVLVKTEGGRRSWWEDIEYTVSGTSLKYTRDMVSGRVEKGAAARIGAIPGAQPQPTP